MQQLRNDQRQAPRPVPSVRRSAAVATVTVRKAVRSDIADLLHLDLIAPRDKARRKEIRRWVKKGQARVAIADGVTVGYGVLNRSLFRQSFIAMLYVDPAHRFNGIGAELLAGL